MPCIVPSQVVKLIDNLFPTLIDQISNRRAVTLDFTNLYSVTAIMSLTDQIPQELISLNPDDYVRYTAAIAAIKASLEIWKSRGNVTTGNLGTIPGLGHLNPITMVRLSLEKCPDEFPAASVPDMLFITDPELRESIRLDVSTAERAFQNGEWKASTVLAGSAIEALLLWKLKQLDQKTIQTAIDSCRSKILDRGRPAKVKDIDSWGLDCLLEVSMAMKIINEDTYKEADLSRDFRNFIHPGKALRLKKKCTKASALTAWASLVHVIESLTA